MANTDHADALRSVQSIIEREFRPRPGQADMIAPNGKAYLTIRTKPAGTVVQALQDLGTRLRALIGEYQGDTVWWRRKPELDRDDKTKFWTARASLALGWAREERAEFMPSDASPAAYPEDCGAGTVPAVLGLGSAHVKIEGAYFCPACGVPVNEMNRKPCLAPSP